MKTILLGHGHRYLQDNHPPRCAPMEIQEWNQVIQTHSLMCIDFCKESEPDIIENVGNDWGALLKDSQTYDYVIESITHMDLKERSSIFYWKSVLDALNTTGIYIGWYHKSRLRLNKVQINEHIQQLNPSLHTPIKRYKCFSEI